jgi:hypothetical protein
MGARLSEVEIGKAARWQPKRHESREHGRQDRFAGTKILHAPAPIPKIAGRARFSQRSGLLDGSRCRFKTKAADRSGGLRVQVSLGPRARFQVRLTPRFT